MTVSGDSKYDILRPVDQHDPNHHRPTSKPRVQPPLNRGSKKLDRAPLSSWGAGTGETLVFADVIRDVRHKPRLRVRPTRGIGSEGLPDVRDGRSAEPRAPSHALSLLVLKHQPCRSGAKRGGPHGPWHGLRCCEPSREDLIVRSNYLSNGKVPWAATDALGVSLQSEVAPRERRHPLCKTTSS
jgi:hypothetical protein